MGWFIEIKSDTPTQRNYHTTYLIAPPSRTIICEKYHKFIAKGCVPHNRGYRRQSTTEDVGLIREAFSRRPEKSITIAPVNYHTSSQGFHKRSHVFAYKVQLVQALSPVDGLKRQTFTMEILGRLEDDEGFLRHIVFSDEDTFHVSQMVQRFSIRIWSSENSHKVHTMKRSKVKVNTLGRLMHDCVIVFLLYRKKKI